VFCSEDLSKFLYHVLVKASLCSACLLVKFDMVNITIAIVLHQGFEKPITGNYYILFVNRDATVLF